MTTPVPTADLLHVAGLTRDHLLGQVAAHSEYRYVIQRGTDVMVAGVASAERITDLTLRRAYLIGALTGSGEMLIDALDRHPEIAEAIPDLRDDALACLSLARAARESIKP